MIGIILRILLFIFIVFVVFERSTKYLVQKYQFNMVIGKPGSGKSTMYASLAYYYLSRGYCVYGTDPITVYIKDKKSHKKIPVQVKKIKVDQIYRYQLPEDSVILIDEIGTIFHSRNFKNFGNNNINFWKRYRHRKLIIWAFSQSFDTDLVLRNLVSQFWILERRIRVFAIARRLIMKPVVVHPQGEGVARITDDFVEDPKLMRPVMGGSKWVYIPKWIGLFDSFESPDEMLALMDIDYSDDEPPYLPKKIYRARYDKLHTWLSDQAMKMRIAYAVVIAKLQK